MKSDRKRTCIGCRGRFDPKEMLRIAISEGRVVVDHKRNAGGRGAYLCYAQKCVEQAKKRGALKKALRTAYPDAIWQVIDEAISERSKIARSVSETVDRLEE